MKRRHVNAPERSGSEKDGNNGFPKDLPCECGLPARPKRLSDLASEKERRLQYLQNGFKTQGARWHTL
jgi:hypothetical protein